MDKHKRPTVTLEDLLHFKRAEKPSEAQWEAFDRSWEKAKWQAAITPLTTRLAVQGLHFFEGLWPRFSMMAAALVVAGLFLGSSKLSHHIVRTPVYSYSFLQGPCTFVCDDLSTQIPTASTHVLYTQLNAGTGYVNDTLETTSILEVSEKPFLF